MPKTMDNQSFAHNRYNYTYHIVFIPNIEKGNVGKIAERRRRDIRKRKKIPGM